MSLACTRRFGVFEVNLQAHELRKHGVRVRLRGQPFEVLALLLEQPGEIVTREQLRARLWPAETFVDFEHSLNTAVKKLRATLGDSPDNSRYIETIPRFGYRFIAPVQVLAVSPIPAAPPAFSSLVASNGEAAVETLPATYTAATARRSRVLQSRWVWLTATVLLLLVPTSYVVWHSPRSRPQPAVRRVLVAVMPFENLTGDAAQDYFSDGLTEEMISQLGRLDPEHLGVIARTSVTHYKHSQEQLEQIGRELGVQYVLEGSVRRDTDKVRISAQLIQMRDQTHLWARQYDRELSSLLALQSEIAQEIADEIQVTLGGDHRRIAADRKPSASPSSYEAYELYLKGRYFWNKRTRQGFQQAIEYFQQAVTRETNYARAYAGLADSYALMSSYNFASPNELMPKARAAALRALQIDDTLAEAHTSLALITENYDWDWQTAEKEYRRAIQLDPNYATAHHWYAEYLTWLGRFDEAFRESERARQLDPLSLIIATDYGAILYFSRQYDRAIEQLRAVLAMEPSFPRAHIVVFAYVEKGMFAEALAVAEAKEWRHSDDTPVWEVQAYVYGRSGQQVQARRALKKYEQWSWRRESRLRAEILMMYVATDKKDEAFALLQEAFLEHSSVLTTLKVEPGFDPLRSDPRFQDLLRRVGLAR